MLIFSPISHADFLTSNFSWITIFFMHRDNFLHSLSELRLTSFLLPIPIFSLPIFLTFKFFLSIPNVSRILKLENCFWKIDISEKTFGWNIDAKIFLVGKLAQKVGIRGQGLNRKIRVKNFSIIFQFEDRFQIFNFRGKMFCRKIVLVLVKKFSVGKSSPKI